MGELRHPNIPVRILGCFEARLKIVGEREVARVVAHARSLLLNSEAVDAGMAATARVETPVPIQSPQGGFHSWFVPVSVGDRLVGFFQLQPDLTVMRYSSFQRRSGSLDGCPAKESWLDVHLIRRRAERHAGQGEKAGEPFLTYDAAPSRLAWAVPVLSNDGGVRVLLVAGQAIWESPAD